MRVPQKTPWFSAPWALLAILWLGGCASVVDVDAPRGSEVAAVLEPPPDVDRALLTEPGVPLLDLSPAMRDFVEEVVPEGASAEETLDALFDTLSHNAAYRMEYDSGATLTAAEAFRQRRANCLSFSAMFIAMAREAGVDARFQYVEVPPSWDSEGDDTVIQYQHVNVDVPLGRNARGVVDFRMDRFREIYPKRIMTDAEARAHYYSNVSMDRLFAGQPEKAWVAARRAIEADDNQAFVWNNMGIVQRHMDRLDEAGTSYRQAIAIDERQWSAINNLAFVEARRGNAEEARRLRGISDEIKYRNPYYRYALARNAFESGAYRQALEELEAALSRNGREHRFYFLRALSQWELEEREAAFASLERAIKMAEEGDGLASYRRQLQDWRATRG